MRTMNSRGKYKYIPHTHLDSAYQQASISLNKTTRKNIVATKADTHLN